MGANAIMVLRERKRSVQLTYKAFIKVIFAKTIIWSTFGLNRLLHINDSTASSPANRGKQAVLLAKC
jgi:hypothetical protein